MKHRCITVILDLNIAPEQSWTCCINAIRSNRQCLPWIPGCGVNLGLRGLESLGTFIYKTATALDQNDVFEALSAKIQHAKQVAESFRQTGLAATMFE